MLFSPAMLDSEAIHIIGSEQFSSYKGYSYGLRYGGDFKDPTPRDTDGSVRTAVTAIDALDGRRMGRHFPSQWKMKNILRELNKAYAGFVPESTETLKCFQELGTGNWVRIFVLLRFSKHTHTHTHTLISHSYLPGMRCVLRTHCIEVLFTMDCNECCWAKTYVLLSFQ